jgi:hypothetical protein
MIPASTLERKMSVAGEPACHAGYNADAETLADGDRADLLQIAPPAGARLVGRFSTDAAQIAQSVALGAACMARTLAGDPAPLPVPAPRRVPFPATPPAAVTPAVAAP